MYTDYVDENEDNQEENDYYNDDGNNSSNDNKEKIKKIAFFAGIFCILLIIIVLLAKGCANRNSNKNNNGDNQLVATIVINRKSVTLKVGEQITLSGDVLNASEDNPIITWISEDTDIVSVDDEGVVTANKEGTAIVTASYEDLKTECEVIVSGTKAPDLESIAFSQGSSLELKKGTGVLLQVIKTPENAKEENITFTTDNSSVATVSDTGYVNAIDTGTTSITAKTENGLTTSITIKVIANGQTTIEPTKLDILGLSNELVVGKTATLKTSIQPSNATNRTLTFASTNPGIATVDSNGVVTGIKAGSCTITASTYNGIRATITVTVNSNTVEATGVEITTGQTISMKVNGVKRIKYNVLPENATNKSVTFTSSNTNVARVDSNGLVAGVGVGSTIITVKTTNGKTAFVTVNVESNASNTGTGGNTSTGGNTETGGNTSTGGNTETGGSTGGNTGGTTTTCSADSIVTIENLGRTDVNPSTVSSISFDNTKPFTNANKTPQIKVTKIDSCVKISTLNYVAYYGTTKTNLTYYRNKRVAFNETISFDQGDGYYKVIVSATTTDSKQLSKIYYATVSRNSAKPTIKLTLINHNTSTNIAKISFSAKSNSNLKISKILYCASPNQEGCTPSKSFSISQNTSVASIRNLSSVQRNYTVCATAYDTNNVMSIVDCIKIS